MIDIPKCIKSFKYAFSGVYLVFKNENNARVHLLATILSVLAGIFFSIQNYEWLWIMVSITLVWICEAINSCIEKLVDLVSPEFNPKAGAVKDMAAGAVLLAALFSLFSGLIIFLPKIIHEFK